MTTNREPDDANREPLSRARVFRAAVELADAHGVDALTMRKLADRLGVQAMSLYYHVANKDQILDGMVDLVFAEFDLPQPDGDWRAEMRRRAVSARGALGRHPWSVGLLDSRATPGPITLRHHDAVLACLRRSGFSVPLAAHAFSVLDSYIYGFVLQEQNLPFQSGGELEDVAAQMLHDMPADAYPYITELAVEHALQPGYAYADEFAWGLELVLDGLERALQATPPSSPARDA